MWPNDGDDSGDDNEDLEDSHTEVISVIICEILLSMLKGFHVRIRSGRNFPKTFSPNF